MNAETTAARIRAALSRMGSNPHKKVPFLVR